MSPKLGFARGATPQAEIDSAEVAEQRKQLIAHEINELTGQIAGLADRSMEDLFNYDPEAFFRDRGLPEGVYSSEWFPADEIRRIEEDYPVAIAALSTHEDPLQFRANEYRRIFESSRRNKVVEKAMQYIQYGEKLTGLQYEAVEYVAEELAAASQDANPRIRRECTKERDRYCHDVLTGLVDVAAADGVVSRKFNRVGEVYKRISGGHDQNVTRRAVAAGLEALHDIDKSMKSPGRKLSKTVDSLSQAFEIGEAGGPVDDDYELFKGLASIIARNYKTTAARYSGLGPQNESYELTGRKVDMLKQLSATLGWQIEDTDSAATPQANRLRTPATTNPTNTAGSLSTFNGQEVNGITISDNPEGRFGGTVRIKATRAAVGVGLGGSVLASTIASPALAATPFHTEEPSTYTVTVPTQERSNSPVQEPEQSEDDSTVFVDEGEATEPTGIGMTVEQIEDPSLTEPSSTPDQAEQLHTPVPVEVDDTESQDHVFIEPTEAETESGLAKTPQELLAAYLSKNQKFVREDAVNLFEQVQLAEAVGDVRVDTESTKQAQEVLNKLLSNTDQAFNHRHTDMSKGERITYILSTLTAAYSLDHPDYLSNHDPRMLYQQDTGQKQRALQAEKEKLALILGPEFAEQVGEGRYQVILSLLASADVQLYTSEELEKIAPHKEQNNGGKHGHQGHNGNRHQGNGHRGPKHHQAPGYHIENHDGASRYDDGNYRFAFEYLHKHGFSLAGASGVIGNLTQESGMNPHIIQGGEISPDFPDGIFNIKGYGIAQWTSEGRQRALIAYAESVGRSAGDLRVQLDFMLKELQSYPDLLHILKTTKSVNQATIQFEQIYERAGTPIMPNRLKYAHAVFSANTKYTQGHKPDRTRNHEHHNGHVTQRIVQVALNEFNAWPESQTDNGNSNPLIAKYTQGRLGPDWAWCSFFATYTLNKAGLDVPRYGLVSDLYKWMVADSNKDFYVYTMDSVRQGKTKVKPGDVIFYNLNGNYSALPGRGSGNHVGIVQKVEGGKIISIDGNWDDQVNQHVTSINDPHAMAIAHYIGPGA